MISLENENLSRNCVDTEIVGLGFLYKKKHQVIELSLLIKI